MKLFETIKAYERIPAFLKVTSILLDGSRIIAQGFDGELYVVNQDKSVSRISGKLSEDRKSSPANV